jgi:hypothetical protein
MQSRLQVKETALLDYLIRPRQHVRRDRQADLLSGLEVDDEIKLDGPLDW